MPPPSRSLLSLINVIPPPPPPPPPSQDKNRSNSLNPSILIISIIIILVILISISIHLLLRFFSRAAGGGSTQSPRLEQPLFDSPETTGQRRLIDSLPVFSFGSIATAFTKSAPDCSVCLSRFEPHDQLRLLPACCHAFHSNCIDTWLASSLTCPLCRSIVEPPPPPPLSTSSRGGSFRLEIGSISHREPASDSRRSYSMGSFDYIVDDDIEAYVVVPVSESVKEKEEEVPATPAMAPANNLAPAPPGAEVAEAVGGRGWLKEYVDRLASSASSSSRALSFRCSGRWSAGGGSSSRSDGVVIAGGSSWDLDRAGEEVSHFFRWLSGT